MGGGGVAGMRAGRSTVAILLRKMSLVLPHEGGVWQSEALSCLLSHKAPLAEREALVIHEAIEDPNAAKVRAQTQMKVVRTAAVFDRGNLIESARWSKMDDAITQGLSMVVHPPGTTVL